MAEKKEEKKIGMQKNNRLVIIYDEKEMQILTAVLSKVPGKEIPQPEYAIQGTRRLAEAIGELSKVTGYTVEKLFNSKRIIVDESVLKNKDSMLITEDGKLIMYTYDEKTRTIKPKALSKDEATRGGISESKELLGVYLNYDEKTRQIFAISAYLINGKEKKKEFTDNYTDAINLVNSFSSQKGKSFAEMIDAGLIKIGTALSSKDQVIVNNNGEYLKVIYDKNKKDLLAGSLDSKDAERMIKLEEAASGKDDSKGVKSVKVSKRFLAEVTAVVLIIAGVGCAIKNGRSTPIYEGINKGNTQHFTGIDGIVSENVHVVEEPAREVAEALPDVYGSYGYNVNDLSNQMNEYVKYIFEGAITFNNDIIGPFANLDRDSKISVIDNAINCLNGAGRNYSYYLVDRYGNGKYYSHDSTYQALVDLRNTYANNMQY